MLAKLENYNRFMERRQNETKCNVKQSRSRIQSYIYRFVEFKRAVLTDFESNAPTEMNGESTQIDKHLTYIVNVSLHFKATFLYYIQLYNYRPYLFIVISRSSPVFIHLCVHLLFFHDKYARRWKT